MSWHFSQALVAEFSGVISLGGEPFAPSRSTSTADECLTAGRTTESSPRSRSGTIYGPSTGDPGLDSWMWSLAASRARTSRAPAAGPGSTANGPASGEKWPESLARYDPASRSWRTHQCSLFGGWESFSETWPRWGMMRDGECWALSTRAPRIGGNESGSWPTPRSCSAMAATITPEAIAKASERFPNLETVVVRRLWPTPRASEGAKQPNDANRHSPCLAWVVKHPEKWPPPTARDWKSGKASQETMERNARPLSETVGGSLNPTWVEWLMGWPLGWTDCAASAMDRFRLWSDSHGRH